MHPWPHVGILTMLTTQVRPMTPLGIPESRRPAGSWNCLYIPGKYLLFNWIALILPVYPCKGVLVTLHSFWTMGYNDKWTSIQYLPGKQCYTTIQSWDCRSLWETDWKISCQAYQCTKNEHSGQPLKTNLSLWTSLICVIKQISSCRYKSN